MSPPVIVVCVVTYNQRDFIATCLRGVVDQRVEADIRVLVGDDASSDGTSEIVAQLADEYPGRIEHIRREARMGPFENMRDLILRAEGDFIARLDGDDYWLPGKLARQLAFLQAHPDCAAVYTNAIVVDEDNNRLGLFNDVGDACFDLAALLRRGNFLNNSSGLFRPGGRQAWRDVAAPQIDYRAHLWHARHGWLGHIGEPFAAYRLNTRGSMVAGMNARVRELYWEAILNVPRDMLSDRDFALGLADFLRRVFFRAVRTREWPLLRDWAKCVFAASPYGRMRTGLLALASILRILWKQTVGLFKKDADGNRQRVLYRR